MTRATPPATPGPPTTAPVPRFAALRHRHFTILWLGLLVSTAGGQMQQVAKVWLIVQRTDSPAALALLGLCYAVPSLLLSVSLTGAAADRCDRVALLRWTQAVAVVQPLAMAALLAAGRAPLWLLFVDTAATAAVNAFAAPAQQALLPALVPRAALTSALSLQAAVWNGAQLVGPALGGALLVALGAPGVFAVNGLSTLAVLAALARLRDVPGRVPERTGAPAARLAGPRYAWGHPPVRALLALTTGSTLLTGAYQVLLPFFARDIWRVGAQGYGLLLSAPGAGALVVTVALAAGGAPRHRAALIGGGTLLGCGALLGFAHAPSYAMGLAALVLAGVAGAGAGTLLTTLLQLVVPDALRGRVMAVRYLVSVLMSYGGGLLGGGLAAAWGPAAAVTVAAVALALATPVLLRPIRAAEEAAADRP